MNNLENEVKDIISQSLNDGIVEKIIKEQFEKSLNTVVQNLFSHFGEVNKIIENKIKSVMIPYLENHDYSTYITKIDSVLVEILKNTTIDNKAILENFQKLVTPFDKKQIKVSELFELYNDHVAKNINTNKLEATHDDGVSYESVNIEFKVEFEKERSWQTVKWATLFFECEKDEEMNVAIRLVHFTSDPADVWKMSFDRVTDIKSLRHLKDFDLLLTRLNSNGVQLILDSEIDCAEVEPEAEPEASWS